jgi:hypothetical protein
MLRFVAVPKNRLTNYLEERQNELLCFQEEEDEGEFEEAVKQVSLFSLLVAESYSFFYHSILLACED